MHQQAYLDPLKNIPTQAMVALQRAPCTTIWIGNNQAIIFNPISKARLQSVSQWAQKNPAKQLTAIRLLLMALRSNFFSLRGSAKFILLCLKRLSKFQGKEYCKWALTLQPMGDMMWEMGYLMLAHIDFSPIYIHRNRLWYKPSTWSAWFPKHIYSLWSVISCPGFPKADDTVISSAGQMQHTLALAQLEPVSTPISKYDDDDSFL